MRIQMRGIIEHFNTYEIFNETLWNFRFIQSYLLLKKNTHSSFSTEIQRTKKPHV